jgi:hypothetical protein
MPSHPLPHRRIVSNKPRPEQARATGFGPRYRPIGEPIGGRPDG